MLTWGERMKFDLSAMPNLTAYQTRVAARPQVQEALRKEGLAQTK
jgi:glutathione S-transferase